MLLEHLALFRRIIDPRVMRNRWGWGGRLLLLLLLLLQLRGSEQRVGHPVRLGITARRGHNARRARLLLLLLHMLVCVLFVLQRPGVLALELVHLAVGAGTMGLLRLG